jgi:hypothetical protein
MAEIEPKNPDEMKRFLFHELSAAKREAIEELFFTDKDFVYDLMELENSLVDAYARGELTGDDLKRFESGLEKSPERREKIANAIALNSLIREEHQTAQNPVPLAETRPDLWQRISSVFNLQMSALQFASAALIFLLLCGTGFLLYERFRFNRELADYREKEKRVEELQMQEQSLQNQLREIRQREQRLQDQINQKQGESEILNQQFESEKNQRERLENELNRLKNLQKNLPQTQEQPSKPTIASVVLSPFLGGRGGGGGNDVETVKLDSNIKSVAATLQLPKEAAAELFLVRFKGEIVASKQKPLTTKSGLRFVTVRIPVNQLSTREENIISVSGSDGVSYDFILKVQK